VTITSEAHPLLYHYTTASGLRGIVETQELWATNIAYLNDAEEHVGFFHRRLPQIIEPSIREALTEISTDERIRKILEAQGGIEANVRKLVADLPQILRDHMLAFHDPYITSFCGAPAHGSADDGLLSQWRGYGVDGGYAIVFDTKAVEALIGEEHSTYLYQFMAIGDAEYYGDGVEAAPHHVETSEWEERLKAGIREFVAHQERAALTPLYEPVTFLACRHKHRGFIEEAEVRIVAIPANDDVWNEALRKNFLRQRKLIHFVNRGGVLVPYIKLFGPDENNPSRRLPIRKVIVGPHPEKRKRTQAVKLLLSQHRIDAEVTASDIPYLGR
jgi:hypothetical protein